MTKNALSPMRESTIEQDENRRKSEGGVVIKWKTRGKEERNNASIYYFKYKIFIVCVRPYVGKREVRAQGWINWYIRKNCAVQDIQRNFMPFFLGKKFLGRIQVSFEGKNINRAYTMQKLLFILQPLTKSQHKK